MSTLARILLVLLILSWSSFASPTQAQVNWDMILEEGGEPSQAAPPPEAPRVEPQPQQVAPQIPESGAAVEQAVPMVSETIPEPAEEAREVAEPPKAVRPHRAASRAVASRKAQNAYEEWLRSRDLQREFPKVSEEEQLGFLRPPGGASQQLPIAQIPEPISLPPLAMEDDALTAAPEVTTGRIEDLAAVPPAEAEPAVEPPIEPFQYAGVEPPESPTQLAPPDVTYEYESAPPGDLVQPEPAYEIPAVPYAEPELLQPEIPQVAAPTEPYTQEDVQPGLADPQPIPFEPIAGVEPVHVEPEADIVEVEEYTQPEHVPEAAAVEAPQVEEPAYIEPPVEQVPQADPFATEPAPFEQPREYVEPGDVQPVYVEPASLPPSEIEAPPAGALADPAPIPFAEVASLPSAPSIAEDVVETSVPGLGAIEPYQPEAQVEEAYEMQEIQQGEAQPQQPIAGVRQEPAPVAGALAEPPIEELPATAETAPSHAPAAADEVFAELHPDEAARYAEPKEEKIEPIRVEPQPPAESVQAEVAAAAPAAAQLPQVAEYADLEPLDLGAVIPAPETVEPSPAEPAPIAPALAEPPPIEPFEELAPLAPIEEPAPAAAEPLETEQTQIARLMAQPPGPAAPEEARVEPPREPAAELEALPPPPPGGAVRLADLGLREGDVIREDNVEQFRNVITPGVQWLVLQGMRLEMIEPRPIVLPRVYREATEKYAGQVRLSRDGLRVENYVAGQPFPAVDPNHPQAVYKIMWNFYYNYSVTDDVAQRYFETRTGSVGKRRPINVERFFIVDHYRKLNYNGRLVVDPKPELPNPEGVRFKESVHPILEPYDLKGVGALFFRYLDPAKQDDNWVYLPQLRRVRRLSTAQRSDALFGQDIDADAFWGYNGHIAWMDYRLLGEQTILATMHARNVPAKWQESLDWVYDDVWEPRRVWVVEARSKLEQYAFGKRVLFIDKESYLIPTADSYDRAGQLWKSTVLMWSVKSEAIPGARLARYEDDWPFQHATLIFDMQLQHATATSIPSSNTKGEEGYLINLGGKTGTTEDFFTVAHLIAASR